MTTPDSVSLSRARARRPRKAGRFAAWAVAYVLALHAVTWLTQGIGSTPDAAGYLRDVALFAQGFPAYFPPGYPIFLAPWVALFPHTSGFAIVGVQHLCMVLTLLALWQMSRVFLGDTLSALGLVLSASMGPTLFLPQSIFSENAALFGMTGALWFASRSAARRSLALELTAGACLSLAALARLVPLPAMIVPLVLIQMPARRVRESILHTMRILSIAVAAVLLTTAWNFVRSGEFAIANSQGLHLYNRVIAEQGILDPRGKATRELLARTGARSLRGMQHWDVRPILHRQGLSYLEAETLLGNAAMEGLRSQFPAFVQYSLGHAWRQYGAVRSMELRPMGGASIPALQWEPLIATGAFTSCWWHLYTETFAALWPFLLWSPLIGVLMLPFLTERLQYLAVLAVPAGYLFITAQLDSFSDRYVTAVLPFALALVPAPIAALINVSRSRLVRARDRSASDGAARQN